MSSDVLTINQAGYLADLIRGVEAGKKLRWYPLGADTDTPIIQVLRAFTDEDGNFWPNRADIRDSFVWTSGMFEHWFNVRDVIEAMDNGVTGNAGLRMPMAFIEE